MIRKTEVRGFDLNLRHVTGGAILIGDGTARSIARLGCRFVLQ